MVLFEATKFWGGLSVKFTVATASGYSSLVCAIPLPSNAWVFFQSNNLPNPSIQTQINNNLNWESFLSLSGQI